MQKQARAMKEPLALAPTATCPISRERRVEEGQRVLIRVVEPLSHFSNTGGLKPRRSLRRSGEQEILWSIFQGVQADQMTIALHVE